jgi:mxaK protein
MKRRTVHAAFACAALLACCGVGYATAQLNDAERLNAAIDQARSTHQPLPESALPEGQFARALALQQAGQTQAALKAYEPLVQGPRADLRRAALYNQANLQLRLALHDGAALAVRSLPLIELAKQGYRELLRQDPGDWDARHNLELALWLAPEADEVVERAKAARVNDLQESRFLPGSRLSLP